VTRHVFASVLFVAVALLWCWPLPLHLADRLPGEVVGDNVAFLWNTWWMRQAGTGFFFSPLLFAPVGADLALHTHTALLAAVGATVLARVDLLTAQNLLIIASLALNGICAYWLAWDRTRSVAGGILGGLIVATAPPIPAHLLGHFNLIGTWPIPLVILCVLRALERRSLRWAAAAGVAAVLLGYTDYYYSVYVLVLVGGIVLWRSGLVTLHVQRRALGTTERRVLITSLALVALLSIVIIVTGGYDGLIGGVRIRATEPGNLLTLGWLLAGITVWRSWRPSAHVDTEGMRILLSDLRVLLPIIVIGLVGLWPIVEHMTSLVAAGDYSSPAHQWRSGPEGIDLLTLLLGNPFHPLTGETTRRVYERFGFDHVEGVGWLGLVPMLVLAWGTRRARGDSTLRPLVSGGWFFFAWALGPWLKIAGTSTGLILPSNLFGLVPVLSNARIPGRALVIVFLVAGVLVARLVASLDGTRRVRVAVALSAIVVIDALPAPVPTVALEIPAIYAAIPHGPGAVLEVPMGIRDGFEEIGAFDERALLHQMTHARPLVGGFLARIPSSTKRRYQALPVVRSILAMSGGEASPVEADQALTQVQRVVALAEASVEYVVLDRTAAAPPLAAFIDALGLERVRVENGRELLRVAHR